MNIAEVSEWTDEGMCDGIYYKLTHKPCETRIMIVAGLVAVCPKCHPEEWAEQHARHSQ